VTGNEGGATWKMKVKDWTGKDKRKQQAKAKKLLHSRHHISRTQRGCKKNPTKEMDVDDTTAKKCRKFGRRQEKESNKTTWTTNKSNVPLSVVWWRHPPQALAAAETRNTTPSDHVPAELATERNQR
jgi:hypothetical protein